MPAQVLLRDGLPIETRVSYPDRRRRGEEVRDLDVVGLERALRILAVDRERADQLAFEEERKREHLREAFRLDQGVITDALGGHVEDHVLAGGAKLRAYFVNGETLLGRVALGKAVVRSYDECIPFAIGEEHRGRVGRHEVAGG